MENLRSIFRIEDGDIIESTRSYFIDRPLDEITVWIKNPNISANDGLMLSISQDAAQRLYSRIGEYLNDLEWR